MVDKDQLPGDDEPVAYLKDHDQLVLQLSVKDKLVVGELGLQLDFSWSSRLRTDGRGEFPVCRWTLLS